MHFIIISKKDSFEIEQINDNYLKSINAPSLKSDNYDKLEIGNFIVYLYLYDHIITERQGYSYHFDENKLLISNGIFNIDGEIRDDNILNLFERIDNFSNFIGDYQLISIDNRGEGFFKTPLFSLNGLYYYEDENCTVLASEVKLIVDAIQNFKNKKFVENYDLNFLKDSIYHEWGLRKFPKNTIFKNIKRVSPHDEKYFKDGKIIVKHYKDIEIPQTFKRRFKNDKDLLYSDYQADLMSFVEQNLEKIKPRVSKINLGLTGGFDSRMNVSILHKLCKKLDIPFFCFTGGIESHPDVIIAKKIADSLQIDFNHSLPSEGLVVTPQKISDYMLTFYKAQGDFNSNNFDSSYSRKYDNGLSLQGMDAYKRYNMNKIYSGERWFARRTLYRKNFFLPLFYTEMEIFFAIMYGKDYKEFIYEILKRSEPKLLEIPIVGDTIPNTNIKPYQTKADSVFHHKMPFLWDYKFVKNQLSPILKKYFIKNTNIKNRIILRIIGLNELDFFINPKINKTLKRYNKNKISFIKLIKKLLKEKSLIFYPKNKSMISIKSPEDLKKKRKLPILMDFASVADMHSFEEIEIKIFD